MQVSLEECLADCEKLLREQGDLLKYLGKERLEKLLAEALAKRVQYRLENSLETYQSELWELLNGEFSREERLASAGCSLKLTISKMHGHIVVKRSLTS